ncbi:MAG: hypothetical protein OJF59_000459 [Cytophagales bacterium]|jgi:hypothetical protein|nr:hypothetical protein [Bacteroidota bacterium]MBS1982363.1 hypothetical protein [Bacteroidota bacterium]WHZ06706.1 MAG: hypothetical protein OJF59_000459 [Cytophagales bacterium]
MKTTLKITAVIALVAGAFFAGVAAVEFPEMTAAKNHMIQAKNNLSKAATQFGGHKAKALEYLDKAIKEVDEAVLYGDKH